MPQPKRFVDPVNVDSINERWSSLRAPAEQHRWVREYSKMTLHTQGRVDDEIIGKRRPYEPTAVRDYRVGN